MNCHNTSQHRDFSFTLQAGNLGELTTVWLFQCNSLKDSKNIQQRIMFSGLFTLGEFVGCLLQALIGQGHRCSIGFVLGSCYLLGSFNFDICHTFRKPFVLESFTFGSCWMLWWNHAFGFSWWFYHQHIHRLCLNLIGCHPRCWFGCRTSCKQRT